MTDLPRACHRDIVLVTEKGHDREGQRLHVITGMAGIGRAYILACAENDRLDRVGLRHEHVEIVGRVPMETSLPMI